MRRIFLQALALLTAVALQAAEPMRLADVLALLEAGVGESVILLQLERTETRLDLGPAEIIRLHEAGAGDELLEALLRSAPGPDTDEPDPAPPDGISFLPSEPGPEPELSPAPAPGKRTPLPEGPDGFTVVQVPLPYPVPVESHHADQDILYLSPAYPGGSWPRVRTPYNRYPDSWRSGRGHVYGTVRGLGIQAGVRVRGSHDGWSYDLRVGSPPRVGRRSETPSRHPRTHPREDPTPPGSQSHHTLHP